MLSVLFAGYGDRLRGKVQNSQLVLVGRVVGEERKGFLPIPMSFAKQRETHEFVSYVREQLFSSLFLSLLREAPFAFVFVLAVNDWTVGTKKKMDFSHCY